MFYRLRSAYAFWQDKQYEDAVRVGEKALEECEADELKDVIPAVKNSISYYYAEIGTNLDKATNYCLEILGLPLDDDFIKQIETTTFSKKDSQIIDTIGRVLESKGDLLGALRVLIIAKKLDSHHPVISENFIRVHGKIKDL